MWLSVLSLLFAFAAARPVSEEDQGKLVLSIANIREIKGSIHIALYEDSLNFLQNEGIFAGKAIPVTTAKAVQVTFEELPYGRYVAAVFHDLNNNGALDKNVLGIPKEPYAFAVREPSKWRDPAFEEVAFTMDAPEKKTSLSLAYWKER